MRRAAAAVVGLALLALAVRAQAADARLADAALAQVGAGLVTLSDVTLARALGLFGLSPSDGPTAAGDLDRYVDGQLAAGEAVQLGMDLEAGALDGAWQAAGGPALESRLAAVGVDAAWARRLVEADLRARRFVELRFRAFAFVTDLDVDDALGPGVHDEAARAATRARLADQMVERARAEWIAETRRRVGVRRLPGPRPPWAAPFSLPPAARASLPRR